MLERGGVDPDTAERAIAALRERALLDDLRYARLFVAERRSLREWGRLRILSGLLARGVDPAVARRALDEDDTGDRLRQGDGERDDGEGEGDGEGQRNGELQRALALLRRRFPEPPRDRRQRDRALSLLLRRGYESELALDALAAHRRLTGAADEP
ncbi:MAG TPA: RecX family transcriptional regulator [Solirubrobacteraceae bacterium]|nr:RecX family transcriptional regulator [Solirubrobacteraceae bacterium]